jgi:hypothetical protein
MPNVPIPQVPDPNAIASPSPSPSYGDLSPPQAAGYLKDLPPPQAAAYLDQINHNGDSLTQSQQLALSGPLLDAYNQGLLNTDQINQLRSFVANVPDTLDNGLTPSQQAALRQLNGGGQSANTNTPSGTASMGNGSNDLTTGCAQTPGCTMQATSPDVTKSPQAVPVQQDIGTKGNDLFGMVHGQYQAQFPPNQYPPDQSSSNGGVIYNPPGGGIAYSNGNGGTPTWLYTPKEVPNPSKPSN